MNLVARELRVMRRHLAQVNRRIATASLHGKVKPGSQDLEKRTVRLILGTDSNGDEILSPPVRWAQQGAARFKVHAVPADNEQMKLNSPSGTIGEGSIADWATYDDDHGAPSDKASEAVIEFDEGSRLTFEKDQTRLEAKSVHVNAEAVTLGGVGGQKVARVGDKVEIATGSSAGLWPIVEGSDVVSAT